MFALDAAAWSTIVGVAACLIAAAAAYRFCVPDLAKWKRLGVPYPRPVLPLFGNFLGVALGTVHRIDSYGSFYRQLAGHRCGVLFHMRTPFLVLRDPALIYSVLIKDFAHFPNHGLYTDIKANPLSDNMFFAENAQWKTIRTKLSPAFSSGKLKLMYDQIKECGDELMRSIDGRLSRGDDRLEVRDVMGKYSTDVIGTCAFGLKLNAINDDDSQFRRYGETLFKPSPRQLWWELSWMVSPALLKVVRLHKFPADAVEFFRKAFVDTMTYREQHGVVRNDVVQALMRARTDLVLNDNLLPDEKFTETQILANAFIMFSAGFETVSTTLSFCLYELALNKSIQDKVREDIKSKLSKYNGEVNSDFLMDLNYLDMVLSETLRKYPVFFALFRKAQQTYRVPNDSLVIEKGQQILIPVHALHYDPEYYSEPEVFDPERFSPENKAKRPSGTYLPFGDGPRMCIGRRFAEMEMKLALVEILSKFEVEPCEKTEVPIKCSKTALITMSENGIWLKFKKITAVSPVKNGPTGLIM